jgi:hypothetical protein
MSELLRDPFGRLREYPNFFLRSHASAVFKHMRKCQDLQLWWTLYGSLYQGITINGRDIHGIRGSHHFYKRITTMDPSDDSSDEDEEMSNSGDESNSEETDDEESDNMSYETSYEESSDNEDDMMSYPGSIDSDIEIIDLTKDDD